MADHSEIKTLIKHKALTNKVAVAVMVAAINVRALPSPTLAQKTWAASAINNPGKEAKRFLVAFVAENKDLTPTQIHALDSAAIQASVDNFYQLFVDVEAGS